VQQHALRPVASLEIPAILQLRWCAHDFTLASDGNGGTIITDPQHPPSLVGSAGHAALFGALSASGSQCRWRR